MKQLKHLSVAMLVGVISATVPLHGQTDVNSTATPKGRVGRVITPQRPKGNLDPALRSTDGTVPNTAPSPIRLEASQLSPQVTDAVGKFQLEANRYMQQQDELRKKLLGASTEAEREKVRETIKAAREAWLEHARSLREELRTRQKELMERLPNRREMLRDAAQDNLRAVRDAAQDQLKHRRRGDE